MANLIVSMMAIVLLTESFCIISSAAAPMMIFAVPLTPELSSPSALIEPKRVHRRAVVPAIDDEAEPLDDMETAAGTYVLRPLFVYRQQMAYRDRQNKRAAHRRAVFQSYEN